MKNSFSLFDNIISGDLNPYSNKAENLFFKNTLKAKYKDCNEFLIIAFPHNVKVCIKDIKPNALKYYYYNDVLSDELKTVKKNIKEYVYELKSDSEIENYIQPYFYAI